MVVSDRFHCIMYNTAATGIELKQSLNSLKTPFTSPSPVSYAVSFVRTWEKLHGGNDWWKRSFSEVQGSSKLLYQSAFGRLSIAMTSRDITHGEPINPFASQKIWRLIMYDMQTFGKLEDLGIYRSVSFEKWYWLRLNIIWKLHFLP